MTEVSERTKYKAQVYDVALNAFFKLRKLDSEAMNLPATEVGWDIAEAMVAAAASGVTYKTTSPDRRFEAASLLRHLADRVEEDGLASLEWSYQSQLLARHAWRPDIRSDNGLEELDRRTDAMIASLMAPLRALTVADTRVIICMSFVRMAFAHIDELVKQHPDDAPQILEYTAAMLRPALEALAVAE
jgi:hypothetical protein